LNYSDNKKYNHEFSQHSYCRGYAQIRARIFVGRFGGNWGEPSYGDWHGIYQHHYSCNMPPHRLAFKVGVPIILLRNLNAALGLCNGTHLIIWHLARRLIVAQIIGGAHVKNIVNIPHITTTTNHLKWSFTL
jgi:hypothetical protein